MEDIEKVMSWLEGLTQDNWREFHSDSEVQNIAKYALELLKEQHELLVKKQKDLNHALNDCAEYRHKIAEQSQIVRCKDCKYVECEGVEGFLVCDISGFSHLPEFFCADGERRE